MIQVFSPKMWSEAQRIFEREDINGDTKLSELDSMGRVELIMAAEEELGVQLTNQEIMQLDTISDLGKLLAAKKG